MTSDLTSLRLGIEELNLDSLAYAAVGLDQEKYYISIIDGGNNTVIQKEYESDNRVEEVISAIKETAQSHSIKLVATLILSQQEERTLGSQLWLKEDIVPYFLVTDKISEETVTEAALEVSLKFDEHGLVKIAVDEHREVEVMPLTTLKSYEDITPDAIWSDLKEIVDSYKEEDGPLVFISATPQGGGVALMRHGLIRFLRELGIEANWYVMLPNSEVFEVTKGKFHNVLQDVASPGVYLNEHDKELYMSWIEENARLLKDVFLQANFIVIDDPQPAGLIPYIKEVNSKAKIVYRSHIHLDRELLKKADSPQQITWQFLWQFIKQADLFVAHPVKEFIPDDARDMVVAMPPTTDPLDGLNKPLSKKQMVYYRKLFNKILLEHAQEPLDEARPYIIQIARFDPSKGIDDVIESFRLLRETLPQDHLLPQLVLVGHGSIDDPDGVPVYNMTLQLLREDKYRHLASDIKVVRLHHNDQILNALLRDSDIALQLSYKEGFEVKVTEALHKGKPVIAYKTGGIPLQFDHGHGGYLVSVEDTNQVANHLVELFTNKDKLKQMEIQARDSANPHYFTVANALRWLMIKKYLLADKSVSDLSTRLSSIS